MKIKNQFIGRDNYGNLQLIIETNSKFFMLNYTNALGFQEISKDEFLKYVNKV